MPATIIYRDMSTSCPDARAEGDSLWLSAADLTTATGWEIKPEGICRDEICIPVPEDRAGMLREDGDGAALDLAEFARYIGQPIARDDDHQVWSFGAPVDELRTQLLSLEAPDFELPDLEGRMHRLSDHRGKKVFLLAWASW